MYFWICNIYSIWIFWIWLFFPPLSAQVAKLHTVTQANILASVYVYLFILFIGLYQQPILFWYCTWLWATLAKLWVSCIFWFKILILFPLFFMLFFCTLLFLLLSLKAILISLEKNLLILVLNMLYSSLLTFLCRKLSLDSLLYIRNLKNWISGGTLAHFNGYKGKGGM